MPDVPLVYIADDDQALVRVLTVRLRHLGLKVRSFSDAMHALVMMHKEPPRLAILDVSMPAGNGLAVCEMMRSDWRLSCMPVIVLTGLSSNEIIARCAALDAHYLCPAPDYWGRLKPLVIDLLSATPIGQPRSPKAPRTQAASPRRAPARSPTLPAPQGTPAARPRLLVIDDDRHIASALRLRFMGHGFDVREAASGMEGIKTALQDHPDVIVLDMNLPDIAGEQVLQKLKTVPATRAIPVVVLTGANLTPTLRQALVRTGAHKVFDKPFDADKLVLAAKSVLAPSATTV